jgi:hypothetical protein
MIDLYCKLFGLKKRVDFGIIFSFFKTFYPFKSKIAKGHSTHKTTNKVYMIRFIFS